MEIPALSVSKIWLVNTSKELEKVPYLLDVSLPGAN